MHTGQHYDSAMSQAFFDELGVLVPITTWSPAPERTHGRLRPCLVGMEDVLLAERPDAVIVRDTNSTVAGALAASKLNIPVVHIEAGERSFDRRMPEETNRIVADHLADLCFCVSEKSARHLAHEGITAGVYVTGDVMPTHRCTTGNWHVAIDDRAAPWRGTGALHVGHRAPGGEPTTRSACRQSSTRFNAVGERIVFPIHPRTRKTIDAMGAAFASHVTLIEPAGYFDMMMLEENARMIATDSGGVQREAYYFARPCPTLRDETEWTETVEAGWNLLVGAECRRIVDAWFTFAPPDEHPPVLGDGTAAERITQLLGDTLNSRKV